MLQHQRQIREAKRVQRQELIQRLLDYGLK
jgi:hypothetical protein